LFVNNRPRLLTGNGPERFQAVLLSHVEAVTLLGRALAFGRGGVYLLQWAYRNTLCGISTSLSAG
jgi:hypothetical protein